MERTVSLNFPISVYVRGIYWTVPERVALFKELFSKKKDISDVEKNVLEACNGKTMKEISHELQLPEDAVKANLTSLESMYLIKRGRMKSRYQCQWF